MLIKHFAVLLLCLCTGCSSYVTPGSAANFADINRADIAAVASVKPSPHFPAHLVLVRVQGSGYESYSTHARGAGKFSVVTTQELLSDEQLQSFSEWGSVAGVSPIPRLLLPERFDSFDDLRLSAAKMQADVMLVYTVETTFRVQGRGYGPLTAISLGTLPDRDAYITSTASCIFVDVRTGFTYGAAEATAKASGLTNVWGSSDTVDKKRIEAEQQAAGMLLGEAQKTWIGIVKRYQ